MLAYLMFHHQILQYLALWYHAQMLVQCAIQQTLVEIRHVSLQLLTIVYEYLKIQLPILLILLDFQVRFSLNFPINILEHLQYSTQHLHFHITHVVFVIVFLSQRRHPTLSLTRLYISQELILFFVYLLLVLQI